MADPAAIYYEVTFWFRHKELYEYISKWCELGRFWPARYSRQALSTQVLSEYSGNTRMMQSWENFFLHITCSTIQIILTLKFVWLSIQMIFLLHSALFLIRMCMCIPHICHRHHRWCLCKKKLPGVNFYRFNAKNWQFTV